MSVPPASRPRTKNSTKCLGIGMPLVETWCVGIRHSTGRWTYSLGAVQHGLMCAHGFASTQDTARHAHTLQATDCNTSGAPGNKLQPLSIPAHGLIT
jgi:hypothetical protein